MADIFGDFVDKTSEPIRKFCYDSKDLIENGRCRNHPGKQSIKPGGLKLHILQVLKMALFLNQTCDEKEIIECVLVHDLTGCEKLPLTEAQRLAIGATKGNVSFEEWRSTPHFRFVVLILISDMWSAYINEKDLWITTSR